MKRHLYFLVLSLALVGSSGLTFAQTRFDVSLEGPWILYEWKNFDGAKSMLLAMTPPAPGHYAPVFTTGDGAQIQDLGIYCVGFNGTCITNSKPFPTTSQYFPPSLLQVYVIGNNVSWSRVNSNAIAFLLPMPYSISNDGIDPDMTTRRDISTPYGDTAQHPAIGVQLHYDTGGTSTFDLLKCTGPSPAACTSPKLSVQNNGTLRIMVKTEEHPDAADACDYHVKMAYHSMLMLLDPTQLRQHPPMASGGRCANTGENSNQCIAYMGRSNETNDTNDPCWVCDPQQDSIPSSCAYSAVYGHTQMSDLMAHRSRNTSHEVAAALLSPSASPMPGVTVPYSLPDFGTQLASFDTLFQGLRGKLQVANPAEDKLEGQHDHSQQRTSTIKSSTSDNSAASSCPSPDDGPPQLAGKFPTLSQLGCARNYLESKNKWLENHQCPAGMSASNGPVELSCIDARNSALLQSRALLSGVQMAMTSGTSGKDCRVATMMVQIQ